MQKKKPWFYYLLILYMATAPIYWLPNFDYNLFKVIKLGIISLSLTGFLVFFFTRNIKLQTPKYYKIYIALVIILFIPFFFKSKDIGESLIYFLNFIFGLLSGLYVMNSPNLFCNKFKYYKIMYLLIIIIVIPSILNFFFQIPDWKPPEVKLQALGYRYNLWEAGFNTLRTGWTVSLCVYVPWSLVFVEKVKNKATYLVIVIALVLPILVAQFISGGRNGLSASLLAVLLILIKKFNLIYLIIITIVLFYLFLSFQNDLFIALRIYDDNGGSKDINDISSDRTNMYATFFDTFFDSPIFGQGLSGSIKFNQKNFGTSDEMHNVILRIFIDHGLIFGIICLLFFLHNLIISLKIFFKRNVKIIFQISSLTVIIGLFTTLFEPEIILGSFQITAIWWLSLGITHIFYYRIEQKLSRNL